MKKTLTHFGLLLLATASIANATDLSGESRSTTFPNAPGVVVEISGSSARQLMLNINTTHNIKENGDIEKRGKNVLCVLSHLTTKCIIRFDENGTAGEWH